MVTKQNPIVRILLSVLSKEPLWS